MIMVGITPTGKLPAVIPGWVNVLAQGVPGAVAAFDPVHGLYWQQGDPTGGLTFGNGSALWAMWADGHVSLVPPNADPRSDLGWRIDEASSNPITSTNDFTNGAWTPTNMTAALNAVGPDLVLNSASMLTATAPNATIMQSITSTSGTQKASILIKAVNVTGAINLTIDGGATWTAVTPGAAWAQVSIPKQTLANPTFGLQIANSGDSVAVWCAQTEKNLTGTGPTAPMPDGYTTRAVSSGISFRTPWKVSNPYSVMCKTSNLGNTGATIVTQGAGVTLISNPTPTTVSTSTISHTLTATLGSGNPLTGPCTIAMGADAAGRSLVANGGAVVSDNFPVIGNGIAIYGGVGSIKAPDGYIGPSVWWTSRLPDATLQGFV